MVGRVGDWDVGVLNLQTAESEALPSENLGVARLRRRVLNPNSTWANPDQPVGFGGAPQHRLRGGRDLPRCGERLLVLNWAQSFDDQEPATGSVGPLDRGIVRLNWERRGSDGLTYALDVARTGELFDPGMGFLRRSDFTKGQASLGYGWRPGIRGRMFTYALQFDGSAFRRNDNGNIETAEIETRLILETWGRHQVNLSVPYRYENLESSFPLPEGNSVPAGITASPRSDSSTVAPG